jgi:hypothetical protein
MTRADRLGLSAAAVIAFGLAGCGAASVQPLYEQNATGVARPTMVVVYRFAVAADEVTENQGFFSKVERQMSSTPMSDEQRRTARESADRLANDLVTGIQGLGLPVALASPDQPLTPNTVLITGAFVDINEGNKLRQAVIGLGAGQSSIDTRMRVLIWSGGREQVLARFETHVDSGEMPGAALTMGAGAAATGGVSAGMAAANVAIGGAKAYHSAMDPMIDRMAEKAVASLSQYFASQGWISPSQVKSYSWTDM